MVGNKAYVECRTEAETFRAGEYKNRQAEFLTRCGSYTSELVDSFFATVFGVQADAGARILARDGQDGRREGVHGYGCGMEGQGRPWCVLNLTAGRAALPRFLVRV